MTGTSTENDEQENARHKEKARKHKRRAIRAPSHPSSADSPHHVSEGFPPCGAACGFSNQSATASGACAWTSARDRPAQRPKSQSRSNGSALASSARGSDMSNPAARRSLQLQKWGGRNGCPARQRLPTVAAHNPGFEFPSWLCALVFTPDGHQRLSLAQTAIESLVILLRKVVAGY